MQKLKPLSASRAAVGEEPTPLPSFQPLAGPQALRILDFDSECRPDAYLGSDITTRSITGIAAQVIGDAHTWCRCISTDLPMSHWDQSVVMLNEFQALYNSVDMVTGHNIRKHDLPIISGAMVYHGMGPLGPKLTSDTLMDGPKSGLVFSRSQENLGEMLEIVDDKYHMNNHRWKAANTLERVELTRARVTSDVHMHIQLRQAMLDRGLLKAPRMWRP